jgi:hypothetical protein
LREIKRRSLEFSLPTDNSALPLDLMKLMERYKIKVNKFKDMQEQQNKLYSKCKDNPNCYFEYK